MLKNINFVITGIEHSGTTLVSDIFRQVPTCESGFEVGVLLKKSPRQYYLENHPWRKTIYHGWGITEQDLKIICDTDDFNVFYHRLITFSSIISHEKHNIFFDKTPRYVSELFSCYNKIKKPFIVLYKDPRATIFSNWNRRHSNRNLSFIEWMDKYDGYSYLEICYSNIAKARQFKERYLVSSLEEICLFPEKTIKRIFDFARISFKKEYLNILNSRYNNTKGKAVNLEITKEYKKLLNNKEIEILNKKTKQWREFFHEG